MKIPGLDEILTVVKNMPNQFDTLVNRLERVIELLEETNGLLREVRDK